MRLQPGVTQISSQVYRLLKVCPGSLVIVPRPQKAQIQDTLPLKASLPRLTRGLQRSFEVRLCLLKVAQHLVGLPACPVTGRGHRLPELLGGVHHARPLFDSGTRREEGLRLLGSALRVFHGLVPQFRFGTVIGQVCKMSIQR